MSDDQIKATIIFSILNFRMESSGRPKQVHISDITSHLISEYFNLEDGEEIDGIYGYSIHR